MLFRFYIGQYLLLSRARYNKNSGKLLRYILFARHEYSTASFLLDMVVGVFPLIGRRSLASKLSLTRARYMVDR